MTDTTQNPTSLLHELERMASEDRLSPEELEAVARRYRVPLSTVHGLRTFYFPDHPAPAGEVCVGLPCALRRSAAGLSAPAEGWGRVSCLGYCARGPVVRRDGQYFEELPGGLEEIDESTPEFVASHREHLSTYRGRGGYGALERYLAAPDPEGLLRAVEGSALRGMGGAGFPAFVKWRTVRGTRDPVRVVLVNAHEGEPATFKDRELLERQPHQVLEGALLAALGVGAGRVVVGLKSEYENARGSLEEAIDELDAHPRLAPFRALLPKVEVRTVPGPYVTGEETALLEALEGRRSEPRLRPPFPAESGLDGHPTLVHNVETVAALAGVLSLRTGAGPPEKLFCLTGDVARPGAYRRPLGTPASELVENAGGSTVAELKAFLPGGLSGGLLPADLLGTPLDFEPVRRTGAALGTGAVVAIGRDRCLVEVLQNLASFFAAESCGKCTPCRLGTAKLDRLIRALEAGRATEADLDEGLSVAQLMQETSICALGQVAGKAFVDAMRYFPDELKAHLRGVCPARAPRAGAAR